MPRLYFTKMEGAGNDFIFINALASDAPTITPELAVTMCDRRFGIGADQILIVKKSEIADFRMDIINADGGTVEMCGNGIRCFAKYVLDHKLTTKTALTVETLAGIIKPEIIAGHPKTTAKTAWVKVDMGEPILDGEDIPVNQNGLIIDKPFKLKDFPKGSSLQNDYKITCVSMGNPHCIVFVDKVQDYPVETIGPYFENDPHFPNRINTEFIEVVDKKTLNMRVWERGSGETLACGTGACAAAVASILNNKTDRHVTIHLRGGDLEIFWDPNDDHVYKTGPATTVFDGIYTF
ncbi:diaminopimelate epimerase [bacterium]|nr:diaminopimelate epimerase [bacterium]